MKNSAVNVEDVESDAMESMLQFIYTAKLDFLESASMELASRLLAAADKYSLPRLKLKLHVLKFINDRRVAEVMVTDGWQQMLADHSHLVGEAYKSLASQQILPVGPPRKRGKK